MTQAPMTIHVWPTIGSFGRLGFAAYIVERKEIRAFQLTKEAVVRDLLLTAASHDLPGDLASYTVVKVPRRTDAPY